MAKANPLYQHTLVTRERAQTSTTTVVDDLLPLDFKWYAWAQTADIGNSLVTVGLAGGTPITSTGTATLVTDATGVYTNYQSSTTQNTNAGWTGSTNHTRRQAKPTANWVIKTGTVITTVRTWITLNSTAAPAPMNADDPAGADLMGFRFSTSAGDTKWQCATKDGTTLGLTDSGVTVAADTRYEMRIDASSGTDVKFYINGTLVATRTTLLPTETVNLQMFALVRTLGTTGAGNDRGIRIRRYQIRSL